MATRITEIFDALRSIGVAEDKATKAAEAMATLEPQFAVMRGEMRQGFAAVRGGRREGFGGAEFAAVRSDLRGLTLRVNLIIAALVTLGVPAIWLLVRIASKTGAIG